MARLNEAPASNDPLETLRRKFLRQNRDIARDNSTKSLRIRALENEVASLLSANLLLSEHILRLENEASASRSRRIVDHVTATRSKLEAKLEEMTALISGLGHVPSTRRRPSGQKDYEQSSEILTSQSPNQSRRKQGTTDREVREGMLPSILEHEQYPRRTTGGQDVVNSIHCDEADASDSPNIGPPPISSFVMADAAELDVKKQTGLEDDSDSLDAILSVNLEQRRRRRESISSEETKGRCSKQQENLDTGVKLLKTGAKRKMCVREDDKLQAYTEDMGNGCRSTRRLDEDLSAEGRLERLDISGGPETSGKIVIVDKLEELSKSRVIRDLAVARGLSRGKKIETPTLSAPRQALGSKNANIDVANSPKKTSKTTVLDEIATGKASLHQKAREMKKEPTRTRGPVPVFIQPTHAIVEETSIQLEPETPAAELSSPTSSAPSARLNIRDTPPPIQLGSATSEEIRPSRRARSAVSYTEPNLRDKMRRPTKELVAAVGEQKAQRMVESSKDGSIPKSTATEVKEEPKDETGAWRDVKDVYAGSPLGNKSNKTEVNLQSHEPEKEISPLRFGDDRVARLTTQTVVRKSNSGTTIATLLSKRGNDHDSKNPSIILGNAGQTMSSPVSEKGPNYDVYKTEEPNPITNDGSEQATSISKTTRATSQVNNTHGLVSQPEARPKLIPSSRRRQSTLGLGSSSRIDQTVGAGLPPAQMTPETGLKRVISAASIADTSNLKRTVSSASVPSGLSESTRSERAAGRRRSMML